MLFIRLIYLVRFSFTLFLKAATGMLSGQRLGLSLSCVKMYIFNRHFPGHFVQLKSTYGLKIPQRSGLH